ncbi:oligosaccharide repeat unit polymerase [Cetobacterium sp. 2A]|uniref:O-antigen polymerase n=1 Tax=Cetobacterium sp. 2A TaxID=2754723 RepID=UPI00163CE476|nr:O-antigen polymerase [Cetobacterium sp. 2A]MBC2856173.1 oligosaccharide repeat unit polymerase [Cetobacterium sp. 2A]
MNNLLISLYFIFFMIVTIYLKKMDNEKKTFFYPPINLILKYFFFMYIYIFFLVIKGENSLNSLIVRHRTYIDFEMSIFYYVKFTILYFVFYFIGFYTTKSSNKIILEKKFFNNGMIILLIGFISFLLYFYKNNGILYLLKNQHLRAHFAKGNGIYYKLFILYDIGVCKLYYTYLNKRILKNKLLFICSLLIGLLFWTILGGRAGAFNLVIMIFMISIYKNKKFKIITTKNISILLTGILYIVFLPILRDQKIIDRNFEFSIIVDKFYSKLSNIVIETSYEHINIFVFNYFKQNTFWYGASYKDIFLSFIPRKLYDLKPPVDDGVYVWNMVIGKENIVPSIPFERLSFNSWPFSNLSIGFANFGIVGIIFVGISSGFIAKKIYTLFKNSKYNFSSFLIFFSFVNLGFSNMRLFNTIFDIFLIGTILVCFEKIKILKKRR